MIKLQNEYWQISINPELGCQLESGKICHNATWVDLLPPETPSFLMAPYSNRIRDGFFEWFGKEYQLKNAEKHALHGPARKMSWVHLWSKKDSACFELMVAGDKNPLAWPFDFKIQYSVSLLNKSVEQCLEITNLHQELTPFGGGFHPYFLRRLSSRDEGVCVNLGVGKRYPTGVLPCIPIGPPVHDEVVDQLNRGDLCAQGYFVDDCFSWPIGEASLHWKQSGIGLKITGCELLRSLVFYNPDEKFFAVEPVANINNALGVPVENPTGFQLLTLSAGETRRLQMTWDLSFA